jgi:streptomycin 6-kinase
VIAVELPETFLALANRDDTWRPWLDALPRLIRDVLGEWRLVPDGAVATGVCAAVVPVRDERGTPAAVKFAWPHSEQRLEHLALQAWRGEGAIRLLRADPSRDVMLLERAQSVDLTTVPVLEACRIVANLYPRLHIPATPQYDLLSEHCARWSRELLDLPKNAAVPRRYVEHAASLAADFSSDAATDGVLVHTDLHYFNVLAAEREPWLAIDPKPLSGDPCFEIAPLLWNRWDEVTASCDVRGALRERFYTVVDVAGFDEDRARNWVIVRELVNVLWCIQDTPAIDADDEEMITAALAITKAVQD